MVNQNLRLARRLGAGGMGGVWGARHLGLSYDVVKPKAKSDDEAIE